MSTVVGPDAIAGPFSSAYFESEMQSKQFLADRAGRLQADIAYAIQADLEPPQTIEEAAFDAWYDPRLPTIAIDEMNAYTGAELLGYANRDAATKKANIVYFAGPEHGVVMTEDGPVVRSGMYVDADGTVCHGNFLNPLPVALVESSDDTLLAACQEAGVPTVTSVELYAACSDKRQLQNVVGSAKIRLPARLDFDQLDKYEGGVVIKPAQDAQGKGVLISEAGGDRAQRVDTYKFLEKSGYEPIIEERINSWPLYDPQTGARLDWNVRAIISNGHYVNMYVRADEWGKPVNKSRGSLTISKDMLSDYARSPEEAFEIVDKLEQAAYDIGQTLDSGVLGLDLTVDEQGEVCMYEVNAGNVGGLQTMARIGDKEVWRADAQTVIDSWLERIKPKDLNAAGLPGKIGALSVSALTQMYTLQLVGNTAAANAIPTGRADRSIDRYAALQTIIQQRGNVEVFLNPVKLAAVDNILMTQFPLELRQYLPSLITVSHEPKRFADFTDRLAKLYPKEDEWKLCSGLIAARTLDIDGVRRAHADLNSSANFKTPALTVQCYQEFTKGLPDDINEDLAPLLMLSSEDIYKRSYDLAALPVKHLRKIVAPEDEIVLNHFLFMMSLASSRYEDAAEAYAELSRLDASETIAENMLTESYMREACMRSRTGIEFLVDFCAAEGVVTPYLAEIAADAKPIIERSSAEEAREFVLHIAAAIPIKAEATERQAFADQLLEFIAAGKDATTVPEAEPEELLSSDLMKYAYLLKQLVNQRVGKHSVAILQDFENRDIISGDLAYISDVLSDGTM